MGVSMAKSWEIAGKLPIDLVVGCGRLSLYALCRVDKPCQFIVFDNGKAGFMGEHSVMDGMSLNSTKLALLINLR